MWFVNQPIKKWLLDFLNLHLRCLEKVPKILAQMVVKNGEESHGTGIRQSHT